MTQGLHRLEGRLFAESGTLFMVVQTEEQDDVARVSYRVNDQTQVIEMPLTEAARRVSAGSNLILDNLNSPESSRRILEQQEGWFFVSREGNIGPYESQEEAGQELGRYILSMQTTGPKSAAGTLPGGKRRQDHEEDMH
ncbi:MAG: DUF6316 family protein [Pseudomonadota bacterium]